MENLPMTNYQQEDKDFTRVYTVTLAGNQVLNNVSVGLDRDADFIWIGCLVNFTGLPFSVQFMDSSNNLLSSGQMGGFALQAANTGVGQPWTLIAPILFPAGAAIGMNLTELSGSTNALQFCFRGLKRFYRKVS